MSAHKQHDAEWTSGYRSGVEVSEQTVRRYASECESDGVRELLLVVAREIRDGGWERPPESIEDGIRRLGEVK